MIKNKLNNKGFTLVELLVSISILAIITIMALPSIRNIQKNNNKKKYETYVDSLVTGAKLYVDAYAEYDMFISGNCENIKYSELKDKNLVKDIKISGTSCNDDNKTFVRVCKIDDKHYKYQASMECKKDSNVVYQTDVLLSLDNCSCS